LSTATCGFGPEESLGSTDGHRGRSGQTSSTRSHNSSAEGSDTTVGALVLVGGRSERLLPAGPDARFGDETEHSSAAAPRLPR